MVDIKGKPYWWLRPALTSSAVIGVGIKNSDWSLSCDPIAQRTESQDVMFYCVQTQPKTIAAVFRMRKRQQLFSPTPWKSSHKMHVVSSFVYVVYMIN